MNETEIEANPNFIRAMFLLENRLHTPNDLYRMWRTIGAWRTRTPGIERVWPWWKGIEL